MANSFINTDLVARLALKSAHEKSQFIATVDRQYDESFVSNGARHGNTLRVKSPNMYTRRQNSRVMSVQEQDEKVQTITVGTQDGVDMSFTSKELMFDTESPKEVAAFQEKYIDPAMNVLISGIESDFIAYATKATYQLAGTAGTAITDLSVPGIARAKLNQQLAPKDKRVAMIDSVTMGTIINGRVSYFNPSGEISSNYREGMVGRNATADWYENDRMWTLANGSDVTIDTDAAALVVDGTGALDFHTLTASAVTVGSVFTIAGVYDCHPETKAKYPNFKQFTLVSGGATTGASVISPALYLTGPRKNVVSSTGGELAASDFNAKTLTFVGLASTRYVQGLMYHKDAFQFVTADMPLKADAASCSVRQKDGISIRVWQGSDIRNDELLLRLDIMYGFAALRPEWACRLIGSAG
jgi:hypothetical protein